MRAAQVTLRDLVRIAEDLGLTPGEVVFERVPPETIYRIAAYRFPRNYAHWSFGRNYWIEKSAYDRGLSRIYELVLVDDPAVAYISDENTPLETVFVMAHVLGHTDLFQRNRLMQRMPRGMLSQARAARQRFLRYEERYGVSGVEQVLDLAHALQYHSVHEPSYREANPEPPDVMPAPNYSLLAELGGGEGLATNGEAAAEWTRQVIAHYDAFLRYHNGVGERDLLRWLVQYAPLPDWQKDIFTVVREQWLYLDLMRRTKILHEGWAAYTHLRILRELDLEPDEVVAYARMHANVARPDPLGINPYALGLKIMEALEKRGVDLLEVTAENSDASLIRNYLDEEMVEEIGLYGWRRVEEPYGPDDLLVREPEEKGDWRRVKAELLAHLERPLVYPVTVVSSPWAIPVPGFDERRSGMWELGAAKHRHAAAASTYPHRFPTDASLVLEAYIPHFAWRSRGEDPLEADPRLVFDRERAEDIVAGLSSLLRVPVSLNLLLVLTEEAYLSLTEGRLVGPRAMENTVTVPGKSQKTSNVCVFYDCVEGV